MGVDSRVRQLESTLSVLQYQESLKALDWLMEEMSTAKGYSRHDGSDYFIHPVDCAQDLINFGVRDQDVITTALLHDMQEDVPGVTPRLVETHYGSRVAVAVDLLSKKPELDYKVDEVMRSYLGAISGNLLAVLGKTADRRNNFGSLRDASEEKQYKQAIETEVYFIPFFKEARNRYPRYAPYFFAAKSSIEPHLWQIKTSYALSQQNKDLKEENQLLQNRIQALLQDRSQSLTGGSQRTSGRGRNEII